MLERKKQRKKRNKSENKQKVIKQNRKTNCHA